MTTLHLIDSQRLLFSAVVSHYSLCTSKHLSYLNIISSTLVPYPLRSFATTAVTSAWVMVKSTSKSRCFLRLLQKASRSNKGDTHSITSTAYQHPQSKSMSH